MKKLWKAIKTVFWTYVIQHSDKAKLYSELKRLQYNVNQYLYTKNPRYYKGNFCHQDGICLNVEPRQVAALLSGYFAKWPHVVISGYTGKPYTAYPLGPNEWDEFAGNRWQNPKRVELLNWLIETIDNELNEKLENKVG